MGGLIRTPKIAVPGADTTAAEAQASAARAADDAEAAARRRNLERNRRGLGGMIATSGRGVLDPLPETIAASRKSLLGE